jgi:hypothetical protein
MGPIEEAKDRLPLPALLHQLGLGEHAKKSGRCPFHGDQRNSFSIWHNNAGRWLWKCHAGCGEGDEITFLEKLKIISNSEAIREFKKMAGVTGLKPVPTTAPPIDWSACVEALTDEHLERLADWRGFSGEFCSWLKQNRLIGLYQNYVAFPVHDDAAAVVAIHYRLDDGSWRYFPVGAKVRPLVIGELVPGDVIHAFESQWDGCSLMERSEERSGIVISRGAGNGTLVAGLLPQDSTVYLWTQNDAAGEKWQRDICANTTTKALLKRAKIPEPYKDLNDWTYKGKATSDDLFAAMMSAETIGRVSDYRSEESTSAEREREAEERLPEFPVECLPPILERQARAISELCGVPPGMAAPMVLGTGSIAIGRGLLVRSLPGRTTPANLFVLVCKTSGSGGSLTFKHATAPLVGMQMTLRREFEEKEKPRLEAQLADVSAQIEKLKKELKDGSCC